MGFAVLGFSVPVFVVGYLLAYVFALKLDWLPVQGYTPISRRPLALVPEPDPARVALGLVYIALIARITRATMLESAAAGLHPHRRAKGAGQSTILSSCTR
jgi:peptide/nickel transport system permease protein